MSSQPKTMPFGEFVALLALLMATVAYSIDAMLPLLQSMGQELSPDAPERAQYVVAVFMIGLGLGTFVAGPISDSFGRKPVILAGIGLYVLAATIAAFAQSLEMLMVARFVQGLGTAAPRVASQALVRDLYQGRMMARVISFSMTIFALVPAVAPFIGATLGNAFGWRSIFWSFLFFGAVSALWLSTRQRETLPKDRRKPLQAAALWAAFVEVLSHHGVRYYLAAMTFAFATMMIWLSEVSLIFAHSFNRLDEFPKWFALIAILVSPASLLNAKLVIRVGMRRMVWVGLMIQLVSAVVALFVFGANAPFAGLAAFLIFMFAQFFCVGLLFGNLNALALEPMGHIAGMAASVFGGVSTVLAAAIFFPMSLFHDGTPVPMAAAQIITTVLAMACMMRAARGSDES